MVPVVVCKNYKRVILYVTSNIFTVLDEQVTIGTWYDFIVHSRIINKFQVSCNGVAGENTYNYLFQFIYDFYHSIIVISQK